MSKEKLYAVKNNEGEYWDFCDLGSFWKLSKVSCSISEDIAKHTVKEHGGNVVTFVEEPEKVVLTKEQAEIVEGARDKEYPATYISNKSVSETSGEEEFLMEAYVNGYTVAKEKKYVVYKELGGKQDKDNPMEYVQACRSLSNPEAMFWIPSNWIINDKGAKFTEKEISDYGLQDCEKEEVTDDGE